MFAVIYLPAVLIMSGLTLAAPVAHPVDAIYVPITVRPFSISSDVNENSIPDATAAAEFAKKTVEPKFWKKDAMPFIHPVDPVMERPFPTVSERSTSLSFVSSISASPTSSTSSSAHPKETSKAAGVKPLRASFLKKTITTSSSTPEATNVKPRDTEFWKKDVATSSSTPEATNDKLEDTEFWKKDVATSSSTPEATNDKLEDTEFWKKDVATSSSTPEATNDKLEDTEFWKKDVATPEPAIIKSKDTEFW